MGRSQIERCNKIVKFINKAVLCTVFLFCKEEENGKRNCKFIFNVAYIDIRNGKGIRLQYDELVLGVFAYSNPIITRPNSNLHRMRVVCAEILIYEIETLITQVIGFLFCPSFDDIKS